MEKLFIIGVQNAASVEQIAGKLRLRTVVVQPSQYHESIGSLAGYAAALDKTQPAAQTLPETGMLVMCGLQNNRMDKLLAALRNAALTIPHKAVLTQTNMHWNSLQLAYELERERHAMQNHAQ